ncbi:DeoR/GlpR family DNA-binding transcription regulator [Profundibacter sp.]
MSRRPRVRQAEICDLVAKRGEITVEVLAASFDTSAETIRRDLTVLADAGHLRKVHGGARSVTPRGEGEGEFEARMRRNAPAKHQIAEKLADLITPHMTLFMDTGSTTLICAQVLAKIKNLTVITNSTRIAETFSSGRGRADVYLLGGRYRGDNAQTVGGVAARQIASYRADMAILTVGAIDARGVMDYSSQEAQIARAMIEASQRLCVVVDHSKFMRRATFSVCDLAEIDLLVTDQTPDAALGAALGQANVEVYG